MKISTLLGAMLLCFSSLSSASLCMNAIATQGQQSANFFEVDGSRFISPDSFKTCQVEGINPIQNSGTIGDLIENAFNLTSPLTFLQQDAIDGGRATNGDVLTISGLTAFNYLAVHYGRGELLFQFSNPITGFSLQDLPRAFSNYRTYSSGVSEVPLPAAGWLFGSVLIGLMGLRRKMN